jgi:alpha-beta hydrolase superfamily lysophospholipase
MSTIRFICSLLLVLCIGCSPRQTVTARYPFWGEAVFMKVPGSDASRSMQLLAPKSADSIKGCLLIVHGMNEHIGRYGDISRHFAGRFIVAGIDLTAHGMSNPVLAKAHESLINGAARYDADDAFIEQTQLDDLQPMREDLKLALNYLDSHCNKPSDHPPLPIFILSHSLGSLVTSSYLLQSKQDPLTARIKGVIFSGPAFSVTEVPGWRGWFQNPFVHFTFKTHENFLNPHDEPIPIMLFNQFAALISVPVQDSIIELLSFPGLRQVFSPTTPQWVNDYLTDSEEEKIRSANDKYQMKCSVLSYVLAVEKEIIDFRRRMNQFDFPYLLIYSEYDPITPSWGNTDFMAATRYKNTHNRVVLLAGNQYHEQLFSSMPLQGQILNLIDDWLENRLKNLGKDKK